MNNRAHCHQHEDKKRHSEQTRILVNLCALRCHLNSGWSQRGLERAQITVDAWTPRIMLVKLRARSTDANRRAAGQQRMAHLIIAIVCERRKHRVDACERRARC